MKSRYSKIIEDLRVTLMPHRFQHVLNVADMAQALAVKYGVDAENAYLAGLLHDLAKAFDPKTMLKKAKDYGIALEPIYQADPQLLHGQVGAGLAKEQYGIEDRDILNAIANHTTGRSGMSQLEKIIYLADYIEVSRDFDGVDRLREAAFNNLDKAVILAFDHTIKFLIDNHRLIHRDTIEGRNDLLNKVIF